MHNLEQLEKKQVGLRLPKYLIDDIDAFTEQFSLNRTDIITEALKSYITEQKEKIFYTGIEEALKEVKLMVDGKLPKTTLGDLIDELDSNTQVH